MDIRGVRNQLDIIRGHAKKNAKKEEDKYSTSALLMRLTEMVDEVVAQCESLQIRIDELENPFPIEVRDID